MPPVNYVFRHTAVRSNIHKNRTYIDLPLINGNPRALLNVSQFWNPDGGLLGTTNAHHVGVIHEKGDRWWAIANIDGASMRVGAAFDVSIWDRPWSSGFAHYASTRNVIGNTTVLDHVRLNGRPRALLFVTPVIPDDTALGKSEIQYARMYMNHAIGVWYNESTSRWYIYNQDFAPMFPFARFHIEILDENYGSWTEHTRTIVTSEAPDGFSEYVLFPGYGSDGPSEFHFVTQNASFRLAAQLQGNPDVRVSFNPHPVGTLWNGFRWRPAIFNEDGAPMPAGVGFNVRHATGILTSGGM